MEKAAGPQPTPSREAMRRNLQVLLAEALAKLSEPQKEVFVLHHLEDRPLAEVGRELGRTPKEAAGLLHKAMKTLRRGLKQLW